jgi:hypothetical protein
MMISFLMDGFWKYKISSRITLNNINEVSVNPTNSKQFINNSFIKLKLTST